MEDTNKEDNVREELTGRIDQLERELIAKEEPLIKTRKELDKKNEAEQVLMEKDKVFKGVE